MNTREPSFAVDVDVTNPGQFFACCGLLELAHRLSPSDELEACFGDREFCVVAASTAKGVFQRVRNSLRNTDIEEVVTRGERATRPVRLAAFEITLDWWIDNRGKTTASKLWAGQQTSLQIVKDLRDAFRGLQDDEPDRLFSSQRLLTGRLGIDPRAAWNALDVGFSPNEQQMHVATFPAVELMGAVGLQGFCPVHDDDGSFRYATWSVPLPICVARAAAAGLIPAGEVRQYRFHIAGRGSYKGFDYATPVGGET